MTPRLYKPNEIDFDTNGVGALSDAVSCTVTEERNGAYELEMTYPVTGIHYAEIENRGIITAKPSPYRAPQPFRIYRISRPLGGIVTISAAHLSYDLSGIPLHPFSATNAAEAMQGFKEHEAIASNFSYSTDKDTMAAFSLSKPTSARSALAGTSGSILDTFTGEFEFDVWNVRLLAHRGHDSGVVVRYGKNMTALKQETDTDGMATGVYPFWANDDGALVVCNPPILPVAGKFDFSRVLALDLSEDFEEQPTPEDLAARAQAVVSDGGYSLPSVSTTFSFIDESGTDFSHCDLCDTVCVQYEALGVNATAKVVKITTDVLNERYTSITVGTLRATLADTLSDTQKTLDRTKNTVMTMRSDMDGLKVRADNLQGQYSQLVQTVGGISLSVVDGDHGLAEIKLNVGGEDSGSVDMTGIVNFTNLATDGQTVINGSNITTGQINASLIKSGVITSANNTTTFDISNGTLTFGDANGVVTDDRRHSVTTMNGTQFKGSGGLDAAHRATSFITGVFSTMYDNTAPQEVTMLGTNAKYNCFGFYDTEGAGHHGIKVTRSDNGLADSVQLVGIDSFNATGVSMQGKSLTLSGNLSVSGTKNRVVDTDIGTVYLHAMESPEPVFCDIGSGVIEEDGVCAVVLSPAFAAAVDGLCRWIVTPTSCPDVTHPLWVEKTGFGALIHGKAGQYFDWQCTATQAGFSGVYGTAPDDLSQAQFDGGMLDGYGTPVDYFANLGEAENLLYYGLLN